jgi:hypothetical protein
MDLKATQYNAAALQREMQWLSAVIETRLQRYWRQPSTYEDVDKIPIPDLSEDPSFYAEIVRYYHLGPDERLVLLLALAPHVQPHLLDIFFTRNADYDRGFTEFGGIKGHQHGGFLPTGETAAFLLAVGDLEKRFLLMDIFREDHCFRKFNILRLADAAAEEPFLSGTIRISPEYLNYFTTGMSHEPDFSMNFPAKRLRTGLDWDHLVLPAHSLEEVGEIRDWLDFGQKMLDEWDLRKQVKPGYRALFYGPPGTGKTLTAALLGKSAGLATYRIDLSMVVSKYIGETEKNLSGVFDQAEHKQWILFFDEADALFGKRTETSSAHDRYANQEVSYLLQRIEDFPGVVILATNMKANLDEAFSRRFQSMIYFPVPGPDQRLRLWKQALPEKISLEEGARLEDIAGKYEMTGGAIINVTRYCALMAMKRGSTVILQKDILRGIRREFEKEGKIA